TRCQYSHARFSLDKPRFLGQLPHSPGFSRGHASSVPHWRAQQLRGLQSNTGPRAQQLHKQTYPLKEVNMSGHHRNTRRQQSGFTLLELLVVLVVLGLLAGIVAPKYFSQLGRSEAKVAKAQIEGLGKALDLYRLELGHYPSSEQGLAALNTAPSDEPRWAG